eukprot:TRINITY_DN14965_c0_g1_i1.p1 TRINITY_DN14965_c0_g1~~TRINITY_DN14965_c0_g1_i1.p1  ORF type:complete len:1041 (+),score=188.94 TRINITY_DN14965_c0_g1_i1:78-3200(+)
MPTTAACGPQGPPRCVAIPPPLGALGGSAAPPRRGAAEGAGGGVPAAPARRVCDADEAVQSPARRVRGVDEAAASLLAARAPGRAARSPGGAGARRRRDPTPKGAAPAAQPMRAAARAAAAAAQAEAEMMAALREMAPGQKPAAPPAPAPSPAPTPAAAAAAAALQGMPQQHQQHQRAREAGAREQPQPRAAGRASPGPTPRTEPVRPPELSGSRVRPRSPAGRTGSPRGFPESRREAPPELRPELPAPALYTAAAPPEGEPPAAAAGGGSAWWQRLHADAEGQQRKRDLCAALLRAAVERGEVEQGSAPAPAAAGPPDDAVFERLAQPRGESAPPPPPLHCPQISDFARAMPVDPDVVKRLTAAPLRASRLRRPLQRAQHSYRPHIDPESDRLASLAAHRQKGPLHGRLYLEHEKRFQKHLEVEAARLQAEVAELRPVPKVSQKYRSKRVSPGEPAHERLFPGFPQRLPEDLGRAEPAPRPRRSDPRSRVDFDLHFTPAAEDPAAEQQPGGDLGESTEAEATPPAASAAAPPAEPPAPSTAFGGSGSSDQVFTEDRSEDRSEAPTATEPLGPHRDRRPSADPPAAATADAPAPAPAGPPASPGTGGASAPVGAKTPLAVPPKSALPGKSPLGVAPKSPATAPGKSPRLSIPQSPASAARQPSRLPTPKSPSSAGGRPALLPAKSPATSSKVKSPAAPRTQPPAQEPAEPPAAAAAAEHVAGPVAAAAPAAAPAEHASAAEGEAPGPLRFAVGERVSCSTRNGWELGTVIKHWEEARGRRFAYRVRTDAGAEVWAPLDSDKFIRALTFALQRFTVAKDPTGAVGIRYQHTEVLSVLPGGSAERAGLPPGARLTEVNGAPVATHGEVAAALRAAPADAPFEVAAVVPSAAAAPPPAPPPPPPPGPPKQSALKAPPPQQGAPPPTSSPAKLRGPLPLPQTPSLPPSPGQSYHKTPPPGSACKAPPLPGSATPPAVRSMSKQPSHLAPSPGGSRASVKSWAPPGGLLPAAAHSWEGSVPGGSVYGMTRQLSIAGSAKGSVPPG